MLHSALLIISILMLVGVAGGTGTLTQIFLTIIVALILMAISIILAYKSYERNCIKYFYLYFVSPDGTFKTIRTKTYAGRRRAIRDYESIGYTFYAEREETK